MGFGLGGYGPQYGDRRRLLRELPVPPRHGLRRAPLLGAELRADLGGGRLDAGVHLRLLPHDRGGGRGRCPRRGRRGRHQLPPGRHGCPRVQGPGHGGAGGRRRAAAGGARPGPPTWPASAWPSWSRPATPRSPSPPRWPRCGCGPTASPSTSPRGPTPCTPAAQPGVRDRPDGQGPHRGAPPGPSTGPGPAGARLPPRGGPRPPRPVSSARATPSCSASCGATGSAGSRSSTPCPHRSRRCACCDRLPPRQRGPAHSASRSTSGPRCSGPPEALGRPTPAQAARMTSDLSIDEELVLHSIGWEPVELVSGASMHSVPYGVWNWGQGEIAWASAAYSPVVCPGHRTHPRRVHQGRRPGRGRGPRRLGDPPPPHRRDPGGHGRAPGGLERALWPIRSSSPTCPAATSPCSTGRLDPAGPGRRGQLRLRPPTLDGHGHEAEGPERGADQLHRGHVRRP